MPSPKINSLQGSLYGNQDRKDEMIQRQQKKAKLGHSGTIAREFDHTLYNLSASRAIDRNNYPHAFQSIRENIPSDIPPEYNDLMFSRLIPQHFNERNYGFLDRSLHIGWNIPPQQHQYEYRRSLHEASMEDLFSKGYMMVPVPISQVLRMPREQMNSYPVPQMAVNSRLISPGFYGSTLGSSNKKSGSKVPTRYHVSDIPRQETLHTPEDSQDQKAKLKSVSEDSSQAKHKKRTKKATPHPSAPRRPLTAYNFFFSADRDLILRTVEYAEKTRPTQTGTSSPTNDILYFKEILSNTELPQDELQAHQESSHLKLQRLLDIHLESEKVKAPHRKLHGKIGFLTLGKLISMRWRELPMEDKKYYFELSEKDSQRFKNQMKQSDCNTSDTTDIVVTRDEAV